MGAMRWGDQKLGFGCGTFERPVKSHRRDVEWAVRHVILKFRGEVQLRIVVMEDIVAQNT